jgi:hypothetical protein
VLRGGRTCGVFVASRFHLLAKRIKVAARRGVETGSMRESLLRVLATTGALALGSLVASCAGVGPYGANFIPEPSHEGYTPIIGPVLGRDLTVPRVNFVPEPSYKTYTPVIGPILGGETTSLPTPGLKPFVGVAPFVTGNDTGGIIQWTPENDANAVQITTDFCAQYHKYPRITSIHAHYGDYIGFACEWRPNRYAYGQRARPSY